MKTLIMSDSHGWTEAVKRVADRHRAEVDLILHCGDSELAADHEALDGIVTVKGNCDLGDEFPEETVEEVNNSVFFAGHGHLLNVKMTDQTLLYKGEEAGADVVCYGHTHFPAAAEKNGILLINPGSLRQPRGYPVGSYAVVELTEKQKTVTFFDLDGNELADLSGHFSK
ncbi:metallophosphoesterase family protein [Salisediminibacterium halotolerans]|uniref:metallophosphoesterase family protein n=1 Tax=Salisediminibacterium halotolerans TaxID=517425 RepID=UPI000EAF02CA|nr:metallophosphoesterase [Salisediminibacterium halotolerans]RLJ81109.1 hypothetical protein BCL39_0047 [Actinophytocola xinjiangensis]RPE84082.1 hypothetical protein EDD67_2644 [Salisediminibacterium halotolerans]TWG38536.1 hypothetical protein BCL52_0047 [Salisediminibacterium halotolerans]GEL07188.1 putative metallophosphoesterase YsnB [Salisediminibacterium halotolerans]